MGRRAEAYWISSHARATRAFCVVSHALNPVHAARGHAPAGDWKITASCADAVDVTRAVSKTLLRPMRGGGGFWMKLPISDRRKSNTILLN